MKSLLEKSEENYDSFNILKNAGRFSSCVHCAYYSAYQLSLHSLIEKFGFQISFFINHQKDSHRIVIDEMCNVMEKQLGLDSFSYRSEMNALKKERSKADYSTSEHGDKHVGKIETKLNRVLCILKNNCL